MTLLALVIIGISSPLHALQYWYVLQTLSYHLDEYVRWQGKRLLAEWLLSGWTLIAVGFVLAAGFVAESLGLKFVPLSVSLVWALLGVVRCVRNRKKAMKKPLVFTKRIWRLVAFTLLVTLFVSMMFSLVIWYTGAFDALWPVCAQIVLMVLGMPWVIWLSAAMAQPVENAIQQSYIRDARRKLDSISGLITIGITGSYGKTSCKVILGEMLSKKYKTFITPASYNTPMGVTRAIRENMPRDTQVFIAEMGSRHVGDIRGMCAIVNPDIGFITSIGPQHLETFGSLENIAKGKYELIECLPEGGLAIFPGDIPLGMAQYRNTREPKVLFGLNPPEGVAYAMQAEEISCGPEGVAFTLVNSNGTRVPCSCRLLGKHNISNILGCAAVAERLDVSIEEIADAIRTLRPVEHRLQLLDAGGQITVIDDSFNASTAGTRAALEVLRDFPGRKVIITPGLIELGESQDAENKAFGEAMASVADIVILVAGNAEKMAEGLKNAGFQMEHCYCTDSLREAMEVHKRIVRQGDVVLFENDLPDALER